MSTVRPTPSIVATTLGVFGVILFASCRFILISGLAGHCNKMFISSVRGLGLKRLSNMRGMSNLKRRMSVQNKVCIILFKPMCLFLYWLGVAERPVVLSLPYLY